MQTTSGLFGELTLPIPYGWYADYVGFIGRVNPPDLGNLPKQLRGGGRFFIKENECYILWEGNNPKQLRGGGRFFIKVNECYIVGGETTLNNSGV